jgi:hypothetical protein
MLKTKRVSGFSGKTEIRKPFLFLKLASNQSVFTPAKAACSLT